MHTMHTAIAPNPVVSSFEFEGWTIRVYQNSMLDAVKGIFVSPGFSVESGSAQTDLVAWIREQNSWDNEGWCGDPACETCF